MVALLGACSTAVHRDDGSGASQPPGLQNRAAANGEQGPKPRQRVLIDDDWRFIKGDSPGDVSGLAYTAAKPWVLPSGNSFLNDPARRVARPEANLGEGLAYVSLDFDASSWRSVSLPHDYAIEGPFTNAISSSMGRLPSIGVAWYRKTLVVPETDTGKSVYLDVDGAMSYSMVWVNGQFVGGWPYGYASYRLNLTGYLQPGQSNVIAIRVDNPVPADAQWDSGSSRWYPGAGVYRNVWLVTTEALHVSHWGTHITTPEVSDVSATVRLSVSVDNDATEDASVQLITQLFELDAAGARSGPAVAALTPVELVVPARSSASIETSGTIGNPKRWGVPPSQTPQRYTAVTSVLRDGTTLDVYETPFGVRTLQFDANQGLLLNGERVRLNGVCLHHDLGALGAALHGRALERQLQIMAEMGSNAIRTSHNPPAPELLELADRMGFLIMEEAFDVWQQQKAALDYHLLFPDWHEQDLRALMRRDRNHPSVMMWSIGNEVSEQSNATTGPALGAALTAIAHEEDPTRPTVAGMNAATPTGPFAVPIDIVGLNYQGTGVRGGPPQYPTFHANFPNKFVVGTETVATFSSRGVYLFPVAPGRGVAATGSPGVDTANGLISSYDLYFADWSSSPDAEFESMDRYPFVGGEFVWTGIDYLGEPTPLDSVARSSYFGIVDLAGFKKDRFYLYQARWRPNDPMAHILPHWTWPERSGQVTPVHVYTSADEAELFLNGQSLGKKSKQANEYRLRWDDVVYAPGELRVVAYKGGVEWAIDLVRTAGAASQLLLAPDRATIDADGRDLSFITLRVLDADGVPVPRAQSPIAFSLSGPGEILATDNGNPTDKTVFPSTARNAFNGMALVIVRSLPGQPGEIVVSASAAGVPSTSVTVEAR